MANSIKNKGIYRLFLFSVLALLCSVGAMGQTKEVDEALKVQAQEDENYSDTLVDSSARHCCMQACHPFAFSLSADFGGADVLDHTDSKNYTSLGLTWAANANVAYRIHSCNPDHHNYLSIGVDLRNYNSIAATTDRLGATAYDNLHYWYAGVPIMYQVVSNHHASGSKCNVGTYGQVGVTIGAMLHVSDEYSDQGITTTYDLTKHYTAVMVQPFVSGGITCRMHCCTYMLGPYMGYVATNMLTGNGISEHVFSFGLRFTTLFLNN